MNDIIEIYDNYNDVGILNRSITEGEEIDHVKEYIEQRKQEFRSSPENKLAIFLETRVESRYPDVVFVEYNPNSHRGWNTQRESLGKNDYKILYYLYKTKGVNAENLVKNLGYSWKEIALAIEKLYDAKLISRINNKWNVISEKISANKIEAVEAKIKNWNDLFKQSLINKNFASESYALMINEKVIDSKVMNKFMNFGIGIYIKEENGIQKISEAAVKKSPVSYNSILFNEWIGKIRSRRRVVDN